MKKIALIGGLGIIGQVIKNGLCDKYDILIIDSDKSETIPSIEANTTYYDALLKAIPKDTDIIFDLTAYKNVQSLIGKEDFEKMNQIYVSGSYNLFEVAKTLNIPKVIYSSTNHVTGLDEKNGISLLGREINETDYPKPESIYGSMKLFGESIARIYSQHYNIRVICLRFGGVNAANRPGKSNPRDERTILYHEDLLRITQAAIESDINFGIYYAVSENAQKPWSLKKLRQDLKIKRSDFVVKERSSFSLKLIMNLRKVFGMKK